MKNYVSNGAKILYNYVLSLIVFGVFVYVFMVITGDKFETLLPIYSSVIFLLTFFMIYSETKKLAVKEKKPQYDLDPYPLKGLLYGVTGFIPVGVIELVSAFVNFGSDFADRIKHMAVNTLLGPVYFIIRIFGEKPTGYVIASLAIPVVAMLGYLAGYYGFSLINRIKKENAKPAAVKFEKSPWNPSNRTGTAASRKKKAGQPKSM